MSITYEQFIKSWEEHGDASIVCEELGLTRNQVHGRRATLKRAGVKLRSSIKGRSKINVKELNALVKKLKK